MLLFLIWLLWSFHRFINARRRILQPMLDASNPDPAPKAKKMKSQHRPTQRFWPDSIVAGVLQTHRSQTGSNSDSMPTVTFSKKRKANSFLWALNNPLLFNFSLMSSWFLLCKALWVLQESRKVPYKNYLPFTSHRCLLVF